MKGVYYMEIIPHGLLTEDFKQSILNVINQHQLDIQTKAIIIESITIQLQMAAKVQTKKELQQYKDYLESTNKTENNNDKKERSK